MQHTTGSIYLNRVPAQRFSYMQLFPPFSPTLFLDKSTIKRIQIFLYTKEKLTYMKMFCLNMLSRRKHCFNESIHCHFSDSFCNFVRYFSSLFYMFPGLILSISFTNMYTMIRIRLRKRCNRQNTIIQSAERNWS